VKYMIDLLPKTFIKRMQFLLGEDYSRFADAYAIPPRRGVRVNTLKISIADFLQVFGETLEPSPFSKDSFYLLSPLKAGADPLHHGGAYYMQEPSASSAVTVLAPEKGDTVLDLCAAPGGKSTQIAALLQGEGLLWSNEYVSARARILQQNIERLGVRNAVVSNTDSARLGENLQGFFDKVLVDAPCSGEGMFRKEPAALTDWSEQAVAACAARQREILHNAAKTVKAGGKLVYSTCTFAPEENEGVAAWFLDTHSDFVPESITVSFGREGFPFEKIAPFVDDVSGQRYDPAACRRIFPFDGGEGHFIAAFRRKADSEISSAAPYAYPAPDQTVREAAELYAQCFTGEMYGVAVKMGDFIRLLPKDLPDLKGCGVLSAGVQLAEIKKGRLEPCHGAFVAAKGEECRRVLELEPDNPRLPAFLHGEQLPFDGENGYTAVTVAGVTCGFGKVSGGKLKNRYPKGLRLL
jgi:NOL1/NOP2/sun family putative RNA methylase